MDFLRGLNKQNCWNKCCQEKIKADRQKQTDYNYNPSFEESNKSKPALVNI